MDDKRRYSRVRRTRQGGFSLFEVLITLAIAGILITLGMPHMGAFVMDSNVSTYANDLVLDFNFARNEAIKRNADVTLCRANASRTNCANSAGDWTQGWIVFAEDPDKRGDGQRSGNDKEPLIRVGTPQQEAGIRIKATDGDTNDIYIYQANGLARTTRDGSPTNQLFLCSTAYEDVARMIQISASGRVRAHPPSGTLPKC